ncbi:hypothetical protein OURE66S_04169 [Oligella ureolytica]
MLTNLMMWCCALILMALCVRISDVARVEIGSSPMLLAVSLMVRK